MWSCCGVLLPQAVFVINKQLSSHLSSVRCHVFSHPLTLGWEVLPHQRDDRRQLKHTSSVFIGLIINLLGFPYPLPSCVNLLSIPANLNVNFLFLEKFLLGASDLLQVGLLMIMPALQLSPL